MRVQWADHLTRETKRLDQVESIEEEGETIVMTTRERDRQVTVPIETDLFVWGETA